MNYQVYFLEHPLTNEVFYVGMGRPGRVSFHAKHVANGGIIRSNDLKSQLIKKIQVEGLTVRERILHKGLSKIEASYLERKYIAAFGRIDLGTGQLTNKTSGGSGSRDAIRTDEWKARQSAAGKLAQNRLGVAEKKSKAQSGKKRSPEQMERIKKSRPLIAEKLSAQRKGGGNPAAKAWMINGILYPSGKDAAVELGVDSWKLKKLYPGCQINR